MFKTIFKSPMKRHFFHRFQKSSELCCKHFFRFFAADSKNIVSKDNLKNLGSNIVLTQKDDNFWENTLTSMETNIKNYPSTMDIKVSELCSNVVFSSKKVLPDVKETITEANVFVTLPRKDFIFKMINILREMISGIPNNRQHILTGPSGIGKTFTLFLLVNELKKHSNFKVVYIPNCYHLKQSGGWIAILKEFEFTFPELGQEFEECLNEYQEKKMFLEDLIKTLENIIRQKNKKYITILVMDQINFIQDFDTYSIFSVLTSFPWFSQFFSQSANNNPQNALKFFKFQYIDKFLSFTEIVKYIETKEIFKKFKCSNTNLEDFKSLEDLEKKKRILKEKKETQKLDEKETLEIQDLENFERIMYLVGFNPREIDILFETPGTNLDEIIVKYETTRSYEISEIHYKFTKEFMSNLFLQNSFLEAIFYMDERIPLKKNLIIDQQLMIKKYNDSQMNFEYSSTFPLAGRFLKKLYMDQMDHFNKDFLSKKMKDLTSEIQNPSLDPSFRGNLVEDLVNTAFRNAHQKKEAITLLGSTASYLSKMKRKIPEGVT